MTNSTNLIADQLHINESTSIDLLIDALTSEQFTVRRNALKCLNTRGLLAVTSLIDLMNSVNENVRWEAAKALGRMRCPESIEALVAALDDENRDVRWMAAESLIKIGTESITPLLHGLIRYSDSVWVREGSAHVLHAFLNPLHKEVISEATAAQRVLKVLEQNVQVVDIPVAAHEALNEMRKTRRKRTSAGKS